MKGLSLFSGIGGIDVALSEYVIPVAYCEIEPYCQSVLLQRMQEGNLPKAPIWDDIRTLSTELLPRIDIIYGGFPCQDISVAGHQEGLEGKRSGLFFEILRLLDETQAPFVFLENVSNIRTKGAERVCKELSERGYDCRWCNISARDVGARHKRERWFLLGYSKHNGLDATQEPRSTRQTICNDKEGKNEASESKGADSPGVLAHARCSQRGSEDKSKRSQTNSTRCCEEISNTERQGLERLKDSGKKENSKFRNDSSSKCQWKAKSQICGIVNDVSITLDTIKRTTKETRHRINRIKALGNSVVPLQVRTAFEILIGTIPEEK